MDMGAQNETPERHLDMVTPNLHQRTCTGRSLIQFLTLLSYSEQGMFIGCLSSIQSPRQQFSAEIQKFLEPHAPKTIRRSMFIPLSVSKCYYLGAGNYQTMQS